MSTSFIVRAYVNGEWRSKSFATDTEAAECTLALLPKVGRAHVDIWRVHARPNVPPIRDQVTRAVLDDYHEDWLTNAYSWPASDF